MARLFAPPKATGPSCNKKAQPGAERKDASQEAVQKPQEPAKDKRDK